MKHVNVVPLVIEVIDALLYHLSAIVDQWVKQQARHDAHSHRISCMDLVLWQILLLYQVGIRDEYDQEEDVQNVNDAAKQVRFVPIGNPLVINHANNCFCIKNLELLCVAEGCHQVFVVIFILFLGVLLLQLVHTWQDIQAIFDFINPLVVSGGSAAIFNLLPLLFDLLLGLLLI